jgi:hypothetical protein
MVLLLLGFVLGFSLSLLYVLTSVKEDIYLLKIQMKSWVEYRNNMREKEFDAAFNSLDGDALEKKLDVLNHRSY